MLETENNVRLVSDQQQALQLKSVVTEVQQGNPKLDLVVANFGKAGAFDIQINNPARDIAADLHDALQEFIIDNLDLKQAEVGFRGSPQQWGSSRSLIETARDAVLALNSEDATSPELAEVGAYKDMRAATLKLSEQVLHVVKSHSHQEKISADSVQIIFSFLADAKASLSSVVDAFDEIALQVAEAMNVEIEPDPRPAA